MSAPVGPLWALVPVKAFDRAKSRLSTVLAQTERAAFAQRLFHHVISTLTSTPAVHRVLVATDSDEVARAARTLGAEVRMDAHAGPLSSIIDAALAELTTRGASAAMVLMADLPQLAVADVQQVISALDDREACVLVSDVHGRHTNVLALALPARIATSFGAPQSFADHCASARAAGLRVAVLENAAIAFDVDAPADHAQWARK